MTDLIEVKTAHLVGEPLAWAVAKAEGLDVHVAKPHYGAPVRVFVYYRGEAIERCERYNPQENWVLGGPLLEKYKLDLGAPMEATLGPWNANTEWGHPLGMKGETALIASCRAITAAKLGDTVQVPKELMP
ncbi:phage protein NinX family protein [Pseudomonas qingdaonensis]|uniref:phage protein NinX family protein n=1 Tax=Pseudomonas qingdaonensis TaxID=2056231 RepID=UPI003516083F